MKAVKIVLGVIVALLAVVVVASVLFLGPIVKTAVEAAAPAAVGVPVTLEKASVSILTGKVRLKNLVVHNPEGFKSDHALRLSSLSVDMKPLSVFSDRIMIDSILIDEPEITFETGLSGSNLGAILDKLKSGEKPATEPDAAKSAPGKKVEIAQLSIEGAKIRLSTKLTGGYGAMIPIPPIRLTDIGKASEGASFQEAVTQTLAAVLNAVFKAVAAAGGLALDGVKAVGGAAPQGLGVAGKAAGQVGGQAVGAMKVTGEQAAKAIEGTGEAVQKGAAKAAESVTGLFGGQPKEPPADNP